MQVFRKDDQTFDTDGRTGDFNWSYYVTAYVMRDWTEGVPHNIRPSFLRRSLPRGFESEEDFNRDYHPLIGEEGLEVRIAPNTYRISYEQNTTDWWIQDRRTQAKGLRAVLAADELRRSKFEEKFVKNAKWMKNLSLDEVNQMKADYNRLAQVEGATSEETVPAATAVTHTADASAAIAAEAAAMVAPGVQAAAERPDQEMTDA